MTKSEYKGLESLYNEFSGQGFDVIAFPSSQFGGQEYKSNEDIKGFVSQGVCKNGTCSRPVQFTMMSKTDVNGPTIHPVFRFLKSQPGCQGHIMWNFQGKFLVSRDGSKIVRLKGSASKISADVQKFIQQSPV